MKRVHHWKTRLEMSSTKCTWVPMIETHLVCESSSPTKRATNQQIHSRLKKKTWRISSATARSQECIIVSTSNVSLLRCFRASPRSHSVSGQMHSRGTTQASVNTTSPHRRNWNQRRKNSKAHHRRSTIPNSKSSARARVHHLQTYEPRRIFPKPLFPKNNITRLLQSAKWTLSWYKRIPPVQILEISNHWGTRRQVAPKLKGQQRRQTPTARRSKPRYRPSSKR